MEDKSGEVVQNEMPELRTIHRRGAMRDVSLNVCGSSGHSIGRLDDGIDLVKKPLSQVVFCFKCGATIEEIREGKPLFVVKSPAT